MKYRLLRDIAGALIFAAIGSLVMIFLGEIADLYIRNYAAGFYSGCYYWASEDRGMVAWDDLIGMVFIYGFCIHGFTNFAIRIARLRALMTQLKVCLVVNIGGLLGAVVGGCFGLLLGSFRPDYYRRMFLSGGETWFDPVHVGVGLGIHQGIPIGLIIGGCTVVCWIIERLKSRNSGV